MENKTIYIKLSNKQQEEFEEWKTAIFTIFGQYGTFDWIITPLGMGNGLKVRSHLTNTTIDLSHEEDW